MARAEGDQRSWGFSEGEGAEAAATELGDGDEEEKTEVRRDHVDFDVAATSFRMGLEVASAGSGGGIEPPSGLLRP